jgi:SAM-dependent methyltransferase
VRQLQAGGWLRHEPIVDLGCGPGRHLSALHEAGRAPIGVDLSAPLLRSAARALREQNVVPELLRGDLRHLPLARGRFGLALSLFTSFGYFDSPAEDGRALAEAARVLRPGGFFVLDFLNAERVRRAGLGRSRREVGEYGVEEARRLSGDGRRVLKAVTVRNAGGGVVTSYQESVTLYGRDELHGLLSGAGFRVREEWGDYQGAPFDASGSPRLVLVSERGA